MDENAVPQFVSMIATLRGVLSSTRDENFAVISLDRAESDRYVEVDIQQLAWFLVLVNVVVVYCPLVEFEVVNPIDDVSDAWVFLA